MSPVSPLRHRPPRPRRVVAAAAVAATIALSACGAPPLQNHVPPWERQQLGDTVNYGGREITVHAVEGNAIEVEQCTQQPGTSSQGVWWVWTENGSMLTPTEKQDREPLFQSDAEEPCHRGWVQFDVARDDAITHVTYRPGGDGPSTEVTWQAVPAGAAR